MPKFDRVKQATKPVRKRRFNGNRYTLKKNETEEQLIPLQLFAQPDQPDYSLMVKGNEISVESPTKM